MKRSRIFLGATTCLLAIAGVAAAKRFSGTVRYYITLSGNSAHCKATPALTCRCDGFSVQCTFAFITTHLSHTTTWHVGEYTKSDCTHACMYSTVGD